jgi:hypothetical protein
MSLLHLTNGTAIIEKMRDAGVVGRIVPWNDVLHEGPVPAGLNPAAMREVRAAFIASTDGSFDEVLRSFAARDAALEDLRGIDEIVLWFEHDLFDQLQFIEILDRLPPSGQPIVTAVPDDDYLGTQPASHFAGLFAARRPITSSQRVAAHDAWEAFRSPDPHAIVEVLDRVSVLPHLAPALRRHLQQFPSRENGLSRTEQQTLEALARGLTSVKDVYRAANHEREEAVFMGDLAFFFHIRSLVPRLMTSTVSPMRLSLDDELALTNEGRQVLGGRLDRVRLCGIDRWLGGVHLSDRTPMWRWDNERQQLHRES